MTAALLNNDNIIVQPYVRSLWSPVGFGATYTGGSKTARKRRHWSAKYKRSINCRRPKGFSQRQHCRYGRRSTRATRTHRR
jgi:hypothetical protein